MIAFTLTWMTLIFITIYGCCSGKYNFSAGCIDDEAEYFAADIDVVAYIAAVADFRILDYQLSSYIAIHHFY